MPCIVSRARASCLTADGPAIFFPFPPSPAQVRSIYWSPDDTKLVSAGMDGAVYEWTMKDCKREKEHVLKGCNYTCVVSTPDDHSVFAVGSDKKLKEFEDQAGSAQISKEFDTAPTVLTQICLPNGGRTLFAASEAGTVRRNDLRPQRLV